MGKKILSGVFALALLTIAGLGLNKSRKSETRLSELELNNVEALAQSESNYDDCKGNGNGCYDGLWHPTKREVW